MAPNSIAVEKRLLQRRFWEPRAYSRKMDHRNCARSNGLPGGDEKAVRETCGTNAPEFWHEAADVKRRDLLSVPGGATVTWPLAPYAQRWRASAPRPPYEAEYSPPRTPLATSLGGPSAALPRRPSIVGRSATPPHAGDVCARFSCASNTSAWRRRTGRNY